MGEWRMIDMWNVYVEAMDGKESLAIMRPYENGLEMLYHFERSDLRDGALKVLSECVAEGYLPFVTRVDVEGGEVIIYDHQLATLYSRFPTFIKRFGNCIWVSPEGQQFLNLTELEDERDCAPFKEHDGIYRYDLHWMQLAPDEVARGVLRGRTFTPLVSKR